MICFWTISWYWFYRESPTSHKPNINVYLAQMSYMVASMKHFFSATAFIDINQYGCAAVLGYLYYWIIEIFSPCISFIRKMMEVPCNIPRVCNWWHCIWLYCDKLTLGYFIIRTPWVWFVCHDCVKQYTICAKKNHVKYGDIYSCKLLASTH